MTAPFGDLFGQDFGPRLDEALRNEKAKRTPKPETKPLPQIRGAEFDGVKYLRAEDVAAALESQAPAVNRRLIDRIRRWAS